MFDCGLVKTNGTVSMAALSLKLSRSVKTIVTETVDDGQQNPQSAAFHRLRRWFLWSSLVFFFSAAPVFIVESGWRGNNKHAW